jgi:hypothetical protein
MGTAVTTTKKKKIYSNAQKEAVGIRVVSSWIREAWDCKWQEYEARNDNGIDGVAIMRRKNRETGGLVFIQVKCGGDGYRVDQKKNPDKIGVLLGKEYIDEHRPRWNAVPGPCVLIFVDDTIDLKNPPAWWVDLKAPAAYSDTNKSLVLVPKNQTIGLHTKGDFHKLCGSGPIDKILPKIEVVRADMVIPESKETMLHSARGFYKNWSKIAYPTKNPALDEILINRVGWRHITRPDRTSERRFQSLGLIGVAKRMIDEIDDIDMLGRTELKTLQNNAQKLTDYLGIRAVVIFPHRHQSVVQVVLKRERIIPVAGGGPVHQKIWFLSVYELRRGIDQI